MATLLGIDGTRAASRLPRWLREPTLHFFVIAAAVLLAHRLVVGAPRTIELSAALKTDLLGQYQDQLGRPPTRREADRFLTSWRTEEALYREALRERIDRDDAAVRSLLIAKLRERLLLRSRLREPTEAELEQYLAQHREVFEAPVLYEHEYIAFRKQAPGAADEGEKYERLLNAGATPESLALRSMSANSNRERLEQTFGAEAATQIRELPPGPWKRLDASDRLLLVRVVRIHGGLPEPSVLRARLIAGVNAAATQHELAERTQAIVEKYRFEEQHE